MKTQTVKRVNGLMRVESVELTERGVILQAVAVEEKPKPRVTTRLEVKLECSRAYALGYRKGDLIHCEYEALV